MSGLSTQGEADVAPTQTGVRARHGTAAGDLPRDGRSLPDWWAARHPLVRHAAVLISYTALGIAVTWPLSTCLAGRLPNSRDVGTYVWDMWWLHHQILHLGDPFTTPQEIAPVGMPLAYHTLAPLIGVLMAPVTAVAGPAFSAILVSVLLPGLLCYAMYRAARLWLPGTAAYAAGMFFGLSSMLTWRSWLELNIAAGTVFLPLALEAAIRLRRDPSRRHAVALGLVAGLCLLIDVESAIFALVVVAVALGTWAVSRPVARRLPLLTLAAAAAGLVSSPQIAAMVAQSQALAASPRELAGDYLTYGVALPQLFEPSPRLASFGLAGLSKVLYHGIATEGVPTFGATLTAMALLGAVLVWRKRHSLLWLAGWLGACLAALGPVICLGGRAYAPLPIDDHGYTLSAVMPYTWIVRLPGMSGFREADRFAQLGLVPAALLAGTAVQWIRTRFAPALLLVAAMAALEFGWSTPGPPGFMPAGLPAVDRPIAADHSASIVVDVPLAIRGGTVQVGPAFPAETLVLASLDGHPRAIAYVSRLPQATVTAWLHHGFYADLLRVEQGRAAPAASIPAAAADARHMNVGWVLVWQRVTSRLGQFLDGTGFRLAYRADGVSVYRVNR